MKDDIYHLLTSCTIAKYMWNIVFKILGICKQNSDEFIILGHTDKESNFVLTQISFLIYKYWLIQSNSSSSKTLYTFKYFIQRELRFIVEVYKQVSYISENIVSKLDSVRHHIMNDHI